MEKVQSKKWILVIDDQAHSNIKQLGIGLFDDMSKGNFFFSTKYSCRQTVHA